jgi:hypothetical protein
MHAPLLLFAALAFQASGGNSFVSKEGGFRVDMPSKPTERTQQMETPFGSIEGRYFAATRGKLAFYASYSDYPPDVPDFVPETVLDRSVAGAVGGVPGAALLSKTDVRLGAAPGKEFEFAFPGSKGEADLCRARFYLDGRRLFSVMLRGPRADVSRVADPFLRSFSLVPREATPKPAAEPKSAPRSDSSLTTRPGARTRPVAAKVFAPPGAGFRVAMPGKPQERTITWQAPEGPIEAHLFAVVQDDVRRLVSYIDRPKPLADGEVDSALEDLVKGSILSGKGTLVAKRPIKLGDHPGREFEFDSPGPDGRPRFVRARAYLAGPRIYQVLIGGPKPKVAGAPGDEFFRSFALTDTPR